MISTVLTVIISPSSNVHILQSLTVDVIIHMMLLCTAVSKYLTILYMSYINNTDTTRIWNSNPFPGMIRLQGGNYSNEGRVEVYCNGQWGTICDDQFSGIDARTICKQLGYNSYSNYDHLSL